MIRRTLPSIIILTFLLSAALAHAVTFTGHVDSDFTGAMCIADPGADDSYFKSGTFRQSGFDISELCVVAESGTLKFGLLTQTTGGANIIMGDADNNGDPASLAPGLSGQDVANLGSQEYFSVVLDFDFNPSNGFSVVIGKNSSQALSDFGVYVAKSTALDDAEMAAMYDSSTIASTAGSAVFASPSATQPHLEFSAAGITALADFTSGIDTTDPNDVMGLYFINGSGSFLVIADELPGTTGTTLYYGMYPLTVAHLLQIDADGDGTIDDQDADDDNDGISDIIEWGLKSCDLNSDGVLSVSQDRSPFDKKFTSGEEGEILKCSAGGFSAGTKDWVRKAAFSGGKYPDFDGDGTPNYLDTDSDNDGVLDKDEDKNGNGSVDTGETSPLDTDTDDDGISDLDEFNKFKTDTDGDGLSDGEEIETYKTDPNKADTDADDLKDGDEVKLYGTDPNLADTDGGGARDGLEVQRKTDPLNPGDDAVALAGPETAVGPGEIDAGTIDPNLSGYSTNEVHLSGAGLTSCSLVPQGGSALPSGIIIGIIVGVLLAVRMRRATGPALLVLLLMLISTPALALDVQLQRLPMNGYGGLFMDNTQMLGRNHWNVAVGMDYTYRPLQMSLISSGTSIDNVVNYFLTQDTNIALGLADWLDVNIAFQSNLPSKVEPVGTTAAATQANFGDVFLGTKFLLLDPVEERYGLGLAVIPFVTFPTGDDGRYFGNDGMTGGFKVVGERYFGRTDVYLMMGAQFMSTETLPINLTVGSNFLFAVGAQHPLTAKHDFIILGEFSGSSTFDKFLHQQNTSPVEMNGGFRKYWLDRKLAATVSVGTGIDSGYGAPRVRTMANLSFFSHPVNDRDEDTVHDPGDFCPTRFMDPNNIGDRPGCPNTQTVVKVVGDRILIFRPINFETGSAVITADSTTVIDQIAALMNGSPELKKVLVEGHTDNIGGAVFNQELSEARAKAVVDALVSKGVSAKRLTAKGWGMGKPITENGSESGRAKNRRVEFHILEISG